MPEPTDSPEKTPYDVAMARLHTYLANVGRRFRAEEEALHAIPGYTEAFPKAIASGSSETAQAILLPFDSQMAIVTHRFAPADKMLEAERNDFVAAFTRLVEADIRRMLATLQEDPAIHTMFRMLCLCRNPYAFDPLVERLQNPVADPPHLVLTNRFAQLLEKVHPLRGLRQSGRDGHCSLDRTLTMRTLGRLGDPHAETAIAPFLTDKDDGVRKAAREALATIGCDSPTESETSNA